MNKKSIPQKPTGTLKERMARLEKEFPADDSKWMLNLESDFTLKALIESAVDALERYEAYVKNGYSCEGLWFEYADATGY
jgi:hypothetical protein